jgi:SSS family transporter
MGGLDAKGEPMSEINMLKLDGESDDSQTAELEIPLAHFASTTFQNKVYLLGGISSDGISSRVFELEVQNGKLSQRELPKMPKPLAFAGATVHRSTSNYFLTILGGVTSLESPVASPEMYEAQLLTGQQEIWHKKDDMPFDGLVSPTTIEIYNEIVVLGGYELKSGQLLPQNSVWGYARVARDGHAKPGWEKRAVLPKALAHPAYAKTGQSHLVIIGGDTKEGLFSEWIVGKKEIQASKEVYAFHDALSVWHPLEERSDESSGGAFIKVKGNEYILMDTVNSKGELHSSKNYTFKVSTKTLSWPDWLMLAAYFLIVAGIGYYFAKRQTGGSSFALGDGQVTWWAAAISLMASGVSTISFMALPALAACIGLANKGPILFMFVGMMINGFITFPILRRLKITSTFEYLEQRFGPTLRWIGSLNSILVQMFGRIGIVVMLPALAISAMVGLPPWVSIVSMGMITTIYAAFGGFQAVIWTDVFQGALLFLGFIGMGIIAFGKIDGGWDTIYSDGMELNRLNFFLTDFDLSIGNMWFAIVGMILGTMSFASDQTTAQRVLSTPLKDVRRMAFMSGGFAIFSAILPAAVGILLFGFFRNNPATMNPVMSNDQMVPIFIISHVPVGLAGLILATMFAAAMSTVSTSVNVCAVLFCEDIYKKFFKNLTPKHEMRVMQIATIVSGVFGTTIAIVLLNMEMPTLWESFQRIMSYVGAGFGTVFILGMFTRRTNEIGAISAAIGGVVAAYFFNNSDLNVHYTALGILISGCSLLIGYVVSLVTPSHKLNLAGLTIFDQVKDLNPDAPNS